MLRMASIVFFSLIFFGSAWAEDPETTTPAPLRTEAVSRLTHSPCSRQGRFDDASQTPQPQTELTHSP